jgi:hypothetical protein
MRTALTRTGINETSFPLMTLAYNSPDSQLQQLQNTTYVKVPLVLTAAALSP